MRICFYLHHGKGQEMSNLYISSSGILCKPFYELLKNTCERGECLGVNFILGVGGFKDKGRSSIDGESMVFVDEFLTRSR